MEVKNGSLKQNDVARVMFRKSTRRTQRVRYCAARVVRGDDGVTDFLMSKNPVATGDLPRGVRVRTRIRRLWREYEQEYRVIIYKTGKYEKSHCKTINADRQITIRRTHEHQYNYERAYMNGRMI